MRYIRAHVDFLLQHYNGGIPLAHFLKNYFRQHPKLGSRDRKVISDVVYSWYRCSRAMPDELPFEEKLYASLLLCDFSTPATLKLLPEAWQSVQSQALQEKIAFLFAQKIAADIDKLTSFPLVLSSGIDREEWLYSMLRQPDLFIRVREQADTVRRIFDEQGIAYREINERCFSLPNGAPVDKILQPQWYVVQDASSQQTGAFLQPQKGERWWDCCSGAGGKSLLLKDLQPGVDLTVSDKRASILHNLSDRFRLYGHKQPEKMILDVADAAELRKLPEGKMFDHIICDVPCSGAGTWARTPEQLYFFDPAMTERFARLQESIAANALEQLKPGGFLFYITCSVFRRENEDVVAALKTTQHISVRDMQLINGIRLKADSMFIAVLQKG